MRVWIAFAGLLTLMACGVDGEPIPPGQDNAPAVDEAETDETVGQGAWARASQRRLIVAMSV